MNLSITKAADEFIETLLGAPEIQAFQSAQTDMENDKKLSGLRERYAVMAQSFREGQMKGTVTQKEISQVKALQESINNHPAWVRYFEARAEMVELLKSCNRAMSGVLGLDFAATAAPAAAC